MNVFGPLHIGLYLHLAQLVRRGYSAPYNARDLIDRTLLRRNPAAKPAPRGDFNLARFEQHHVTLIAAGDNGVWHRDSLDLMYEWLRRSPRIRCSKHVFAGCNIQELYWGRNRSAVYDACADGVGLASAI
jgi:hypothetical protein